MRDARAGRNTASRYRVTRAARSREWTRPSRKHLNSPAITECGSCPASTKSLLQQLFGVASPRCRALGTATHDGRAGIGMARARAPTAPVMSCDTAICTVPTRMEGFWFLVGDDPGAKSSTVPCATERTPAALGMPVLFPRNSEELIVFGLYGIELSRASGCWVGMKVVADVADGLWSVDNDFAELTIERPQISWQGRSWTYQQRPMRVPSDSLAAEADLVGPRWEMVQQFAARNAFDRVEVDTTDAWLGIAAVGTSFDHTRQALRDLGLDDASLRRAGIRLLRIGMPYPLAGTCCAASPEACANWWSSRKKPRSSKPKCANFFTTTPTTRAC